MHRTQSNTIVSIQYMRGIAAAMVVFAHTSGQITSFPSFLERRTGESGVDIFFIISGFIMAMVTTKSEADPKKFVISRIIRVVPLYWLCTTFTAFLLVLAPSAFRESKFELGHFLLSLFFIPHENPAIPGSLSPLLRPGWTLNYEMFFYVIFTIALLISHKYRYWLTICLLASLGLLIRSDALAPRFYFNEIMLEFAYGIIIAILRDRGLFDRFPLWLSLALLVSGGGAIIVLTPFLGVVPRSLIFGAPAAAIVVGALSLERYSNRSSSLEALGNASYTLYLSHLFPISMARVAWIKAGLPITGIFSATLFTIFGLAAAFASGLLLYKYVERPLLEFYRKLVFGSRDNEAESRVGQNVLSTKAIVSSEL